jgi:hypothetical protein
MSDPVGVQDIEESPGVVSLMRKGVKAAISLGRQMVYAGVALSAYMIGTAQYQLIPVALALIAGGPALIAGALGFKAYQAQAENRPASAPYQPSQAAPAKPGAYNP